MKHKDDFPRVLIIGQTFQNHSGGGITLSNLFKMWPKEKLAVLSHNHLHLEKNEICDQMYGLERYRFPLNLKYRKVNREPGDFNKTDYFHQEQTEEYIFQIPKSKVLDVFNYLGIIPYLHRKKLDNDAIQWVNSFNPDVIYTQLADYALMKIVLQVSSIIKKPVVVHFMDNWIDTIYKGSFFNLIFRKKSLECLNQIVSRSSLILTISDLMAKKYQRIFSKPAYSFHYIPIHVNNFNSELSKQSIKKTIGYFGRIGIGMEQGIHDLILAVKQLVDINLMIHSPDYKKIEQYKCDRIIINPPVQYNQLNKRMHECDLLFIPADFLKEAASFLKYSMPTKVSEYLFTGIPILLYAPPNYAVTDFFKKHQCGIIVDEHSVDKLTKAISNYYMNKNNNSLLYKNIVQTIVNHLNYESKNKQFKNILNHVASRGYH